MGTVMNFVQENQIWVGFIAVVIVVYLIWMPFYLKKRKRLQQDYLSQHPDAAKVFLTTKALITSEAVNIHEVNGDYPALFAEGGKSGFYAKPGVNTVVLSDTHTRPGVFYKNVTNTTGEVRQEIEVEPGGSYLLGFDRDGECFTLEELASH